MRSADLTEPGRSSSVGAALAAATDGSATPVFGYAGPVDQLSVAWLDRTGLWQSGDPTGTEHGGRESPLWSGRMPIL